ncbi:MAG: tyrosine-protein phosphatase [Flectobacillus sp.]|uniref:tyrosine-protein phosphatase n=1 Tax=Flectobacillus sp. TaxID=50419 RepID=UPI003B99E715
MFSFFKSKQSKQNRIIDFLSNQIVVDIHSHLLPGIDDGAPDVPTSLYLIEELQNLGFKKLITTPHIRMEVYPNSPSIVQEKLAIIQQEISEKGLSIQLNASAEYYIDDNFNELLQQNDIIPFPEPKYILAEYPMIAPLMNFEQRVFEMTKRGYTPIIAHPERYRYWHNMPEAFQRLKDLGCLLQLNILAIEGYYGPDIKECAKSLLKNNLYDLIGTDLHHERHLGRLKRLGEMNKEMQLLEKYSFQNKVLF